MAVSSRLPGPAGFSMIARAMAMRQALGIDAAEWAASQGAHPSVVSVIRAGTVPATTDSSNWAGDLLGTEAAAIVDDFSAAMANSSVFFNLLQRGAFGTVPMYANLALTATALLPAGGTVNEGKPTVISKLSIDKVAIAPVKVLAILVATSELLKANAKASGLFTRELMAAVGIASDSKFFSLVTNGLSAAAATSDVIADIRTLLDAVDLRRGSPFFVAASDTAKALATAKAIGGGDFLFEDASPVGGELLGIPLLVSDGVSDGTLTLLNSGQIAVNFGGIALDTAAHASLELQDSGLTQDSTTSTGAELVSLWQNDLVAIRCGVKFSTKRIRDVAIKQITGGAAAWAA